MLSRTVVLQGAIAIRRDRTLQLTGVQFRFPKQLERLTRMEIGARMGSTTNRNPSLSNIHLIGGATTQKRQSLKWLQCRSNERFKTRVSSGQKHPSLSVANNGMNTMD
jgi:hypothetical protein